MFKLHVYYFLALVIDEIHVHVYFIGNFIKEKDRCKKCKGKQVLEEECKLEVSLDHVTIT